MLMKERIKDGIQQAKESFIFVWNHPQVFLFWVVPILLTLSLAYLNVQFFSSSLISFISFLLNIILTAVITFFALGCMHYTMHLLEYQKAHVNTSLKAAFLKLGLIALWTLVTVIGSLITNLLLRFLAFSPLLILFGTAFWLIATFYILPIIAVERMSIAEIIKLAAHLTKNTFIELISGASLFMIIFFIIEALLGILAFTSGPLLIVYPIAVLGVSAVYAVQVVYAIFRTMMYYHFYKKNMDEVQIWSNPEF